MEIEANKPCSSIYNLIDGTVFSYNGSYYIKTENYDSVTKRCTCVNLSSGAVFELTDNMVVQYYDAKVVIR